MERFKLNLIGQQDTSWVAVGKPRVGMSPPEGDNASGIFTLLLGAQRPQEHI